MKGKKILIAVATYPTAPNVHPDTVASIKALTVPDGITAETVYIGDDVPTDGHYANLVAKHNQMRQMVIGDDGEDDAGDGFDALLSIEADMIVPPDALVRLLKVKADVAYGLYCARSTGMWLVMTTADDKGGRSLAATPKKAREAWGETVESKGVGMGCTLIHRRVLDQIEFRWPDGSAYADDWWFALDVAAAGFTQAHDLGVVCGHIVEDGVVMWPDPEASKLHRIDRETVGELGIAPAPAEYRLLRPLHVPSMNRMAAAGEVIVLGEVDARVLIARGFIEAVDEHGEFPARMTRKR